MNFSSKILYKTVASMVILCFLTNNSIAEFAFLKNSNHVLTPELLCVDKETEVLSDRNSEEKSFEDMPAPRVIRRSNFLDAIHKKERVYQDAVAEVLQSDDSESLKVLTRLDKLYSSLLRQINEMKKILKNNVALEKILDSYKAQIVRIHAGVLLDMEMRYSLDLDSQDALKKHHMAITKGKFDYDSSILEEYYYKPLAETKEELANLEQGISEKEKRIAELEEEIDAQEDISKEKQTEFETLQQDWWYACEQMEALRKNWIEKVDVRIHYQMKTMRWVMENAVYSYVLLEQPHTQEETQKCHAIVKKEIAGQFALDSDQTKWHTIERAAVDQIFGSMNKAKDIMHGVVESEMGNDYFFPALCANDDAWRLCEEILSPAYNQLHQRTIRKGILAIAFAIIITVFLAIAGLKYHDEDVGSVRNNNSPVVVSPITEKTHTVDSTNYSNSGQDYSVKPVQGQKLVSHGIELQKISSSVKAKYQNRIKTNTAQFNANLLALQKKLGPVNVKVGRAQAIQKKINNFFSSLKQKNNKLFEQLTKQTKRPAIADPESPLDKIKKIKWEWADINNNPPPAGKKPKANEQAKANGKVVDPKGIIPDNMPGLKRQKVNHGSGNPTPGEIIAFASDGYNHLSQGMFRVINPITGTYAPVIPDVKPWKVSYSDSKDHVVIPALGVGIHQIPIPSDCVITDIQTQHWCNNVSFSIYRDWANDAWYLNISRANTKDKPQIESPDGKPVVEPKSPTKINTGYIRLKIEKAYGDKKVKPGPITIDPSVKTEWEKYVPVPIKKLCKDAKTKSSYERKQLKRKILGLFYYTTNPLMETHDTGNFLQTAFTYYALKCDGFAMMDMILSYLLDLPQSIQTGYMAGGGVFRQGDAHAWIITPDGIWDPVSSAGQTSPLYKKAATTSDYQKEFEYIKQRAKIQRRLLRAMPKQDWIAKKEAELVRAQRELEAKVAHQESLIKQQEKQAATNYYQELCGEYENVYAKVSIPKDTAGRTALLGQCKQTISQLSSVTQDQYQLMALGNALFRFIERIEKEYSNDSEVGSVKHALFTAILELEKTQYGKLNEPLPSPKKPYHFYKNYYNYTERLLKVANEFVFQSKSANQYTYTDSFSGKSLVLPGELDNYANGIAVVKDPVTGLYKLHGDRAEEYKGQVFKYIKIYSSFSMSGGWIAIAQGQDSLWRFIGPLAKQNNLSATTYSDSDSSNIAFVRTIDGDILVLDRKKSSLMPFAGNLVGRYHNKSYSYFGGKDKIYVFGNKTWLTELWHAMDDPNEKNSPPYSILVGTAISEQDEQAVRNQKGWIKWECLPDGRWLAGIHQRDKASYILKGRGIQGLPNGEQAGELKAVKLFPDGSWIVYADRRNGATVERLFFGTFWDKLYPEDKARFIYSVSCCDDVVTKLEMSPYTGKWITICRNRVGGESLIGTWVGPKARALRGNQIRIYQLPNDKWQAIIYPRHDVQPKIIVVDSDDNIQEYTLSVSGNMKHMERRMGMDRGMILCNGALIARDREMMMKMRHRVGNIAEVINWTYPYLQRIEAKYYVGHEHATLPWYRFDLRWERVAGIAKTNPVLASQELGQLFKDMEHADPNYAVYFDPDRSLEILTAHKDLCYQMPADSLGIVCKFLLSSSRQYLIVDILGHAPKAVCQEVVSQISQFNRENVLSSWLEYTAAKHGMTRREVILRLPSGVFYHEKDRRIMSEMNVLLKEYDSSLLHKDIETIENALHAFSSPRWLLLQPETIKTGIEFLRQKTDPSRKFDIEYKSFPHLHPVSILRNTPAWTKYMTEEERKRFTRWQEVNNRLNEIFRNRPDLRGDESVGNTFWNEYIHDAGALAWTVGLLYLLLGALASYHLKKHDKVIAGSARQAIEAIFRASPLLQSPHGKRVKALCDKALHANGIFSPSMLVEWNALRKTANEQLRVIMDIIMDMAFEPTALSDMKSSDKWIIAGKKLLWLIPCAGLVLAFWDSPNANSRKKMNKALTELAKEIGNTSASYKSIELKRQQIADTYAKESSLSQTTTQTTAITTPDTFSKDASNLVDQIMKTKTMYILKLPAIGNRTNGIPHKSIKQNNGYDFAEYREYQVGDDSKAIDWKKSASSDKLLVKTYYKDIAPRIGILIDMRKSFTPQTMEELVFSLVAACHAKNVDGKQQYDLQHLIFILPGEAIKIQRVRTKNINVLIQMVSQIYKESFSGTVQSQDAVSERVFYGKEKNQRYVKRQKITRQGGQQDLFARLNAQGLNPSFGPLLAVGMTQKERETIARMCGQNLLEWHTTPKTGPRAQWVMNGDTRSHRFRRYFKDKKAPGDCLVKSRFVFEKHLQKIGITDKAEIDRILDGGIFWTKKSTGQIIQKRPEIIKAMADALSDIVGREITVQKLEEAIKIHEAVHQQLKRPDIIAIRDKLIDALGEDQYKSLLDSFQRMYGSYAQGKELTVEEELVVIEEIVAQYALEKHLDNPLRLLDESGQIIALDHRVVKIIQQSIQSIQKLTHQFVFTKTSISDIIQKNKIADSMAQSV